MCDGLGQNDIVRVDKNSGPVLSRLWTKVHKLVITHHEFWQRTLYVIGWKDEMCNEHANNKYANCTTANDSEQLIIIHDAALLVNIHDAEELVNIHDVELLIIIVNIHN